jgi:hypothetical protein
MELPYASYMHKIIPNLDKRTDIVRNESIQSLLKVSID